jgi:peptidoglycan/LPS O-acetylase OafA/YrhL
MGRNDRLHALDAVRAFALLLGVVFHAGFSFIPGMIPGIWAMVDNSPSVTLSVLLFAAHIFRMSLFFFVAGFFARMLFERGGARGFWANRARRILVPLLAGWVVIFPAIAGVWVWGLTKTFGGRLPAPAAEVPPALPGAFPLTHLWFL